MDQIRKVKYFSNFCIHCEVFTNLKYMRDYKIPSQTNFLWWSRCKKHSTKDQYDPYICNIPIGGLFLKRSIFRKEKSERLIEIKEAIKVTGSQFQIWEWPLCKDLLDDENCLKWKDCNTWFCAFCLLERLKWNESCSCCCKKLKRSDIASSTEWRDQLHILFSKRYQFINNSLNQNKTIEQENFTNPEFNEFTNYIDLKAKEIDEGNSQNNSIQFSDMVRALIQQNNFLKEDSPQINQIDYKRSLSLEKEALNGLELTKLDKENKGLNQLAQKLNSDPKQELNKKIDDWIRAIKEVANEKINQIRAMSNGYNCDQFDETVNKVSKTSTIKDEISVKREIIEISDNEENLNYEATLKLSFANFYNENINAVIILDAPTKMEAILKNSNSNEWRLFIRLQDDVNYSCKCETNMKSNPFIQMIRRGRFEEVKSNGIKTQVAKLVLQPEVNILQAKGYLTFNFSFYKE